MSRRLESVVVVSATDGHARVDRATMMGLGAESVAVFASGLEAKSFIAANQVDLVVTDSRLADMDGENFVRVLKADRRTRLVPVLMSSLSRGRSDILSAVAAGCAGFVVRPYSLEAFERQLRLAVSASMVPGSRQNMHARAGELSTGAHDRRVAGRSRAPRTPREMFAQGRRLLSSRDLDGAAAMFAQAVRGARTYPEACHGLAQAHARKGDKQAWGFWLRKAVMQYAFQDRFHEVRNLYDKVRAAGLGMRNPFYSVALIHYRRQDHDEAMLALRRALKLTPGDERALLLVSNIHLAQGRLVGAIDFLEGQLEKHGTPRVRAMYDALTADPDAVAAPPRMADRIERTLGSIREKIENMMPERMGRMLPARIPGHPGCSEGM